MFTHFDGRVEGIWQSPHRMCLSIYPSAHQIANQGDTFLRTNSRVYLSGGPGLSMDFLGIPFCFSLPVWLSSGVLFLVT